MKFKKRFMVWVAGAVVVAASSAAVAELMVNDNGSPTGPGAPKALNCGGIHGNIGRIDDWVNEATGTASQRSSGYYGGAWAHPSSEHQFDMVPPQSDNNTDTVYHRYHKATGSPQNLYLTVTCESDPVLSGSSNQWDANSPGWWWNCTCNVLHGPPLSKFRISGGDWQTVDLTLDGDATNDSGSAHSTEFQNTDPVDVPAPVPNPPPTYPVAAGTAHFPPNLPRGQTTTLPKPTNYPKSTGGYVQTNPPTPPPQDQHLKPAGASRYQGKTPNKLPLATSNVEVSLQLNVDAVVGCDNAEVNNWQVLMLVNLTSAMTSTKP